MIIESVDGGGGRCFVCLSQIRGRGVKVVSDHGKIVLYSYVHPKCLEVLIETLKKPEEKHG